MLLKFNNFIVSESYKLNSKKIKHTKVFFIISGIIFRAHYKTEQSAKIKLHSIWEAQVTAESDK